MKLTYKKDHNLVQLMNELIEQNAINTATDFVESKANEINEIKERFNMKAEN